VTGGLRPGPLPTNRLDTPLGEISSDANLFLREDFPPSGTAEFDLEGRTYLRFTLPGGEPARRAEVRLGFRERPNEPRPTKECVSFLNRRQETGDNPRIEQDVRFETFDQSGQNKRPKTHIRERQTGEGKKISGLDCEWELRITLPRACSSVELTLTPLGTLAKVQAFNKDDGSSAGESKETSENRPRPEVIKLTGRAIGMVVIKARSDPPRRQVLLNEICFESFTTSKIRLRALFGSVPVAGAEVEGRAGEIVSRTLEFDAISAIEIVPLWSSAVSVIRPR
jgi:hypothetical protein